MSTTKTIFSRANKEWSMNDDKILRSMVSEGKNTAQISTTLGRSRSAVMNRKYVLNIGRRIASARKSTVPYTGSERGPRTKTPAPKPVAEVQTPQVTNIPSFGQRLDEMIASAKTLGLSLSINISSNS